MDQYSGHHLVDDKETVGDNELIVKSYKGTGEIDGIKDGSFRNG